MKKAGLILALAALAGFFGYGLARWRYVAVQPPGVETGADITWLQREFGLTEAEFAAIRELHRDYAEVCDAHCREIAATRERLETLRAEGAGPDAIASARQEIERLEAICNEATRAHIYRVAAKMPLEAGVRFIRATEPHVAAMPHDGARGLSR